MSFHWPVWDPRWWDVSRLTCRSTTARLYIVWKMNEWGYRSRLKLVFHVNMSSLLNYNSLLRSVSMKTGKKKKRPKWHVMALIFLWELKSWECYVTECTKWINTEKWLETAGQKELWVHQRQTEDIRTHQLVADHQNRGRHPRVEEFLIGNWNM